MFFSSRRDCGGTRQLWGRERAIRAAWVAPPTPPAARTHTHTHRRSVSPLSRSGPSLPAPSRPRSLLFFFFLFFPAAAAALPPFLPPPPPAWPRPGVAAVAPQLLRRARRSLYVRRGGVWGEGAGRGRGRSPHKAAPPGGPSRTMEEGPPFPAPRRGVRVWRGRDPRGPFPAAGGGRGGAVVVASFFSSDRNGGGGRGGSRAVRERPGRREGGRPGEGWGSRAGSPRPGVVPRCCTAVLLYPGASGRRGPQRFVLNSRSGLGRSAPAEGFTAA